MEEYGEGVCHVIEGEDQMKIKIIGIIGMCILFFGMGVITASSLPATGPMSYELFMSILPIWVLAIAFVTFCIITVTLFKDEQEVQKADVIDEFDRICEEARSHKFGVCEADFVIDVIKAKVKEQLKEQKNE